MFFFFSSRRRHTSSYGDWSSDVCSSDLGETISVGTPVVDPFGLGTRVPTLIVSPYAKRGVVAHGLYDHASILKLIEWRFGLEPLTERDRRAPAFLEAFDFGQRARPPIALP